MTTRFEVITGGGGGIRRRWSREEKERLVAASLELGVTASQIARSAGIHTSQLFRWRKQLCETSAPPPTPTLTAALVPVIVADPAPISAPRQGSTSGQKTGRRRASDRIEIELTDGRRIRVDAHVDGDALAELLDRLDRRR